MASRRARWRLATARHHDFRRVVRKQAVDAAAVAVPALREHGAERMNATRRWCRRLSWSPSSQTGSAAATSLPSGDRDCLKTYGAHGGPAPLASGPAVSATTSVYLRSVTTSGIRRSVASTPSLGALPDIGLRTLDSSQRSHLHLPFSATTGARTRHLVSYPHVPSFA